MSAPLVFPAEIVIPHEETRARDGKLRLTRRGRIVFGMFGTLVVAALLALAAALGAPQAQASAEAGGEEFGYVVIAPDSSLWNVAAELDPSSDPRDLISEIVRLNQLEGSGVQAGQPVAVPLRFADAPGVVSASDLGIEP